MLHVFNPYLHAHSFLCALVELRDSTRDCHIPNMTLKFDRLTFQLSNSEEQLGNLYDIAVLYILTHLAYRANAKIV